MAISVASPAVEFERVLSPGGFFAGFCARAFDGYGEKVEAARDVRPALERGLEATARGRLALIDIRLDPVN